LLLILLPVFMGVPGSDRLFRVCALVVLISVVIHGGTPTLLARIGRRRDSEEPPPPEPLKEVRSLPIIEASQQAVGAQTITLEELDRLHKLGEEVIILDVRTERSRDTSDFQAQGSVRMPPENVVEQARRLDLPTEAWLIAYCA
jgi:NhaP-type Na+/H+ and K+/H+ antiporter